MAIPSRPLVLNIDGANLTLDDLEVFEAGGFSVKGFKAFMGRYSNWTPAEIGAVTVAELKDVAAQIAEQLKGAVLPKVNAPT